MTGYESKKEMARDKLEDDDTQIYQTELTKLLMESYDRGVADALEETKKALAQPAQEPVAWMVYTQEGQSAFVTDNPAQIHPSQRALPLYATPQQVQEPWRESASDYERGVIDGRQMQAQSSVDKAVNAMTQRHWVGLTDGVMCDIAIKHGLMSIDWIDFARDIEAALRSKNI